MKRQIPKSFSCFIYVEMGTSEDLYLRKAARMAQRGTGTKFSIFGAHRAKILDVRLRSNHMMFRAAFFWAYVNGLT